MAENTVIPDDKIKQEPVTTDELPPSEDPNKVQVDVEKLKKTKVHICMPCYGGQLTESTFMSFIRWSNTARQLGIDWTVETLTNESLISRARNTLVAKFLSNPDWLGAVALVIIITS